MVENRFGTAEPERLKASPTPSLETSVDSMSQFAAARDRLHEEVARERIGLWAAAGVAAGAAALGVLSLKSRGRGAEEAAQLLRSTVGRELSSLFAGRTSEAVPAVERGLAVRVDGLAGAPAAALERLSGPAVLRGGRESINVSGGRPVAFEESAPGAFAALGRERPPFAIRQMLPSSNEFAGVRERLAATLPLVISRNEDKALRILVEGRDALKYASSGFVLPSGEIATALHVLNGADGVARKISAVFPGTAGEVPLQFKTSRKALDLAVLRSPRPDRINLLGPHELRTEPLQAGDLVVGLGYPQELTQAVAHPGVVRSFSARPLPAPDGPLHSLIESRMLVHHGNSGCPLYDEKGRLSGMIVQRDPAGNPYSYAVPIMDIMRSLGS